MAAASSVSLAVAGAALVLMSVIMSYQVFTRFVLRDTPFWSEETTLVLMVYFGFFSAAPAYREGAHIAVKLLIGRLGARGSRSVEIAVDVLMGLFGVFMIVCGAGLIASTYHHTLPALAISVGFSYLPIPLAGALIALFAVEKIVLDDSGDAATVEVGAQ